MFLQAVNRQDLTIATMVSPSCNPVEAEKALESGAYCVFCYVESRGDA
jgi:hypothetical protein